MPEYSKTARLDILRRRSEAFTKTGRKVAIGAIRRDDGSPATSIDESAALLRNHWSKELSKKETETAAMNILAPHIQAAPHVEWYLPFDRFVELIKSLVDSGVGPDGIPYSAWIKGGETAQRALYNLYTSLLQGGDLCDDFNEPHDISAKRRRRK